MTSIWRMGCSASIAISSRMFTATGCFTANPAQRTIECIDCHGTIDERPNLMTSGKGGMMDQDGKIVPVDLGRVRRLGPAVFLERHEALSAIGAQPGCEMGYSADDRRHRPALAHYNAKARYAKTLHRDGKTWGDVPATAERASESWRTIMRTWIARFATRPGRRVASAATCR